MVEAWAEAAARAARYVDAGAVLDGARGRGEGPAALAARRAAMVRLAGAELPDRVAHLWRYTDPLDVLPLLPLAPDGSGGGPRVTRADEARRAGVEVVALGRAGFADGRLGALVPASHGLLEALNGAAWEGGLAVRVPRGVTLVEPLEVAVDAPAGATSAPRLLVVVEDGAEATVVERHTGGDGGRVVGVTELFVGAGARARYVLDQDLAPGATAHLTERARLGDGAALVTVLTSFGGRLVKVDVGATLAGAGAESELVGVALASGRQHLDHHTVHRHEAPRGWSNIDLKVAVADRARSAYTGLIRIEAGAVECEAYQEERNLLLGRQARADAIPELEILNREVKCSHGSTTSPVDEGALFYLRSRGLDEAAARRVVVRGFFEGALARVPLALREGLERRVEERLARLDLRRAA